MSALSDIIKAAVLATEPNATFQIARRWNGQVTAHQLTSIQLPFYLYDDLDLQESGQINTNFSDVGNQRFILTRVTKIDTHAQDSDKETVITTAKAQLRNVMSIAYRSIPVQRGQAVNYTLYGVAELFGGYYAGAALDMRVPYVKPLTPCVP